MVVACAFGHVKGSWRSLLTGLDLSESNISIVIATCSVLHNICEAKGEKFPHECGMEADRLAGSFEQPTTRTIRRAQQGALSLQEALKTCFSNEPQ